MDRNMKIKWKAIRCSNGKYAVAGKNCVVYEAQFTKAAAQRIAELENSTSPPKDWRETEKILVSEGVTID